MDERVSCTVDELAEALAVLLPRTALEDKPASLWASEVAGFLKADRIPEPVIDTEEDWIYE